MRTELYSLRANAEEVSYINDNLRSIVSDLEEKATIKILFKTEIDRNPRKIKAELFESYDAPNPPELQLFVNALDTKDNTSFLNLFKPFLEAIEKEIIKSDSTELRQRKLIPQIKVHTLSDLPGDYPAYCFTIMRRKFLVLPRITLVDTELTDYIAKAVATAKETLFEASKKCPNGYVYFKKENKKNRDRFDLCFDTEEEETTSQHITALLADTPDVMFEETFYNSTLNNESNTQPRTDLGPDSVQEILFLTENDNPSHSSGEKLGFKSRFKNFLTRTFPVKGDSIKEIIRKVIILLAVIAFFTGAFLLLKFYVFDPAKNNADISDIQEIFYSETDSTADEGEVPEELKTTKNWAGLKKVNKDIVGWIKIDNTKIDYPVLWYKGDNQDSQFYIYRNYKKEYSTFGSIFVDYRCKKGAADKHVILHGHNMGSDDSMFGSLLKYAVKDGWTQGNTDFYKKAPVVHFDTPDLQGDWVIFSVMKINASNSNKSIFNYLQTEFESDSQFMNFIYNIKMRSYLKVDVPINENDRILTLSTCSYEMKNMRTIVVARQVRPGEDITTYVAKAKKTSPYSTVYSTFKDEYEANRITWYDGNAVFNDRGELEFIKPGQTFTVTFLDGRGKVYATQKILKGQDAKAPIGTPPGQPSDGEYYYRFTGWSGNLKKVTSNRVIQAKYEKVKIPTPIQEPDPDATQPTEPEETTVPVTTAPTTPPVIETTPPVTDPPAPEVTDPPEPEDQGTEAP